MNPARRVRSVGPPGFSDAASPGAVVASHNYPSRERARVLLEILQWHAAQHDSGTTTYNW